MGSVGETQLRWAILGFLLLQGAFTSQSSTTQPTSPETSPSTEANSLSPLSGTWITAASETPSQFSTEAVTLSSSTVADHLPSSPGLTWSQSQKDTSGLSADVPSSGRSSNSMSGGAWSGSLSLQPSSGPHGCGGKSIMRESILNFLKSSGTRNMSNQQCSSDTSHNVTSTSPNMSFRMTAGSTAPPSPTSETVLTVAAFGVISFIAILVVVVIVLVSVVSLRFKCQKNKESEDPQKPGSSGLSESGSTANGEKESITLISMKNINMNNSKGCPSAEKVL